MNPRTQLIVDTFSAVLARNSNSKQKLKNGLNLRQTFYEMLGRGEIPTHPKWEWLRAQTKRHFESLLEAAKQYKSEEDKISLIDLMDICQMTMEHIRGAVAQGAVDPDEVRPTLSKDSQDAPELVTGEYCLMDE